MNKTKKLIKNIITFAIGNIGSKLVLFFMVPLYTKCLSTDQYGTIEIIETIEQLLIPFMSIVVFDAVIRFGLSKYEQRENVLKCALFVVLLGSIITILTTPLIGLYPSVYEWRWYISIYVILNMFNSVLLNYVKVENKNILYALISIFQTLILALSNIIFLLIKDLGIKGYMCSIFASLLIANILCIIFGNIIFEFKRGKLEKVLLKQMLIYSAPLIINNISWWIIHSSDKLMLELMISTEAVGIYAISAKIPSLINVVTSIFQSAWSISSVNEIENDNESSFYSQTLLWLMTLIFGVTICIIFILKPFMRIYVSSDFSDSWKYVPTLMIAACSGSISSFYGCINSALKKNLYNMYTTLIGAIINIVLNYFFILLFGIMGAAIATTFSYFAIAITRMIICKKHLKFNMYFLLFFLNEINVIMLAIAIYFNVNIYFASIASFIIFIMINFQAILSLIRLIKQHLYKNTI